jgi:hypothetical protein
MSTVLPPGPPRPRPGKWRRRLLVVLGFPLLLGGAGVLYFHWSSTSALTQIMAELDVNDPGWRLDDMVAKRKQVPDEQNAALHIMALTTKLAGQSIQTVATEKLFDNLGAEVQLNEQQVAYLRQRFRALKNMAQEARKLKDMPYGRFPIEYTTEFVMTKLHCHDARGAFELLQWDAALRAHDFDVDGALESCLALLHATRAAGEEPMFIPQLIRYAGNAITIPSVERALAQSEGPPTEASLKRLQTALETEALEPTFLYALRGERAGMHQLWQALADGTFPINKVGFSPPEQLILERFPGYLTRQHAAMLRFFTNVIQAAKLRGEQRWQNFRILEQDMKDETNAVRTLLPAFMKFVEAEQRTQASLHGACAGLAAERFRLARNDWPRSLETLVEAGLLGAVPVDPFDGKPLRLKRTFDGLVIYSVGPDKLDNDGFINRERPIEPGTDLGFRLWDPPRRRQPPNPVVPEEDLKR